MKIEKLTEDDVPELNRLFEKFFSHQFEKTDFLNGFLSSFVIKNDDKIIMGGGIRPIAETILITDKEANPHTLGDALLEALRFSLFTCERFNIELLHAFVKDEIYARHLIKQGFKPRCQALYKVV